MNAKKYIATVSICPQYLQCIIFERDHDHFNSIAYQQYALPTGTVHGMRINGIYAVVEKYSALIASITYKLCATSIAIKNPVQELDYIHGDTSNSTDDQRADTVHYVQQCICNSSSHTLRYTLADWFIYQILKQVMHPEPLVITLSLYASHYYVSRDQKTDAFNNSVLSCDSLLTIAHAQKKPYCNIENLPADIDEYTLLTHTGLALMAWDAYEYLKFY